MSPDRKEVSTNMGIAVGSESQSQIDIPRDRRGRIRWDVLGDNPNLRIEVIELEAGKLLEDSQVLAKKSLIGSGNNSLLKAVQRFYPGSLNALRMNLGIESKTKPKGFWTPEIVEQETMAFYEAEVDLTQKLLHSRKRSDLIGAIRKYPEGMRGLKLKLGIPQKHKPKGFWTAERVRQEAQGFFDKEGDITQNLLTQRRRNDLQVAIGKYYPGKLIQLKIDLGQGSRTKPDGYWQDPVNIKREALDFLVTHKSFSRIRRYGYSTLDHAVSRYYPGGWRGLRTDLEVEQVRKPKGYWTPEVIENTAREFVSAGNVLTEKNLKDSGNADLCGAIGINYPGGINALKEKLGLSPSQRPTGYWENTENIENEVKQLIASGFPLTQQGIHDAGVSSLDGAIRKNYPGGMRTLKAKFGVSSEVKSWPNVEIVDGLPKDKSGRVVWAALTNNTEQIITLMEAEGRRLLLAGSNLTHSDLSARKASYFLTGVSRYYPGGINQLRRNLNQRIMRIEDGYWTSERIEAEAREFLRREGNITESLMQERDRNDLVWAISKYLGGFSALRERLGLKQIKRPDGYWTPELIKEAALTFYQIEGGITQKLLAEKERADLLGAISQHYPGKFRQLKLDLGLDLTNKPEGYWTPETIEEEVKQFLQAEGKISQKILQENERTDLAVAIGRKYPGGWPQLRKKLDLQLLKMPKGYWTTTTIEQEAVDFYKQFGILTQQSLVNKKKSGLAAAISNKYPGGIVVLREKLGIITEVQDSISPDEANVQLRKLLEEEI